MKMVSLAAIAAVLGMTTEQIEKAEESDLLEHGKKLRAKAEKEPEPAVAISGVKLTGLATEAEAAARISELSKLQIQLSGITGAVATGDQVALVLAWKTGAENAVALSKRVAELEQAGERARIDAVIHRLNAEGKLAPAQNEAVRKMFPTAQALDEFALSLAPKERITLVAEKTGANATTLTDDERQACKAIGISEADYLKEKNRARAQVGG